MKYKGGKTKISQRKREGGKKESKVRKRWKNRKMEGRKEGRKSFSMGTCRL